MTDWNAWIQILTRLPGVIVWILLLAAAIVFHLRRPGPVTVVLICSGVIVFLVSALSLVCEMMMQSSMNSQGAGGPDVKHWLRLLSKVYLVHLAGALVYSFSLLLALLRLPRGEQS